MPSKVVTPRRDRGAGFPSLSPLSSPVEALPRRKSHVGSSKGSNFADSSTDEDSDGPPSKGKSRLQPFPMLASQPQPISHSPYTGSSYKPRVDGERDLFADDLGELADDSLFIDQSADPSTLCPFCDEKLPPNPSPLYHTLLDAAKRKASPDPRPTNTRGLRAKMGIYIASCQRHRFEAHQVPKAIAKGWPTAINFGGVRERVEKLSGDLARLVNGEGEARNQCIYWTTVMKEVQKIGSRAATGVKGQFENFEKTQPGYYGELGSMILHQTLYNMFPPSSFDAQAIMPLTPQEFIQRILVPEAALALIMEDTGQDRVRAAQTMRDSAAYGVAMFPDTSEGPGIGAGEDIVLERARVRRRELDAEEEIEAQLRTEEEEAEQSTKSKGTKRPKKLASTTTTDIEETSARRKFKRTKAGSRTDVEKPEESATLESSPPSVRRSTRTASRSSSVAPQPDLSSPQYPCRAVEEAPALPDRPTRAPEDQQHERLHTASDMDVESDAPRKSSASRLKKNGSIHAPIDVDAQVIEIFDTPSPSEHSSPIPAEVPRSRPRPRRVEPGAQESSGAENPAAENDIATPKPKKPHARPLKGGAPASRSGAAPKGAISALLAQEGRESSVEVIEPPQNRKPTAWRSRMADPLNDTSDEGSVQARSSPVGRSRPGRDHNNDWLLDDSSD
ncbi:RTC4-like domain-containing protein [Gloeopeniophorella convolvens]|nr:RTC4-like domain-containing protein [Gloeopeniophorella convolvens]